MGFYKQNVVPSLINVAMRNAVLVAYRKRLVEKAEGRVLEIGIGSGLNLLFYGADVSEVIGLEPCAKLLSTARAEANRARITVRLLRGEAEAIPLDDKSVQTVVSAWSLCSVCDIAQALCEIRRVLAPDGRLIFVEHGLAPDLGIARWQSRLNPLWRKISGGCNLDRDPPTLMEKAGLSIDRLEMGYMEKRLRLWTYFYEGAARRR